MQETSSELTSRIAGRVREERLAQGLSLEALATRCGVSRSMLSLVERGESSPTAVVLAKLASGLGVTLASLFDPPPASPSSTAAPLARRGDQPIWQDPASGYRRRSVSPRGIPQPMQIVEVVFPPGACVAFENGGPGAQTHQQVWLLEGSMRVTIGQQTYLLGEGDCLAMQLDRPTMFHNPSGEVARYAVVVATEPGLKR